MTLLGEGRRGAVLMVPTEGPAPGGGTARGVVLAAVAYGDTARRILGIAEGTRMSVSDGATPIIGTAVAPDGAPVSVLRAYGRTWTVRAWTTERPQRLVPALVGGLGVIAALMVGALILQAGRREGQVAHEVIARTRELQEERDRSEALIGQAHDGIALVRPDLGIARANNRFREITGRDGVALSVAAAPFPWWGDDDRDAAMRSLQSALAGRRPAPVEVTLAGPDGPRPVLLGHAPLMDGRPGEGAVEVITDISTVRRAQQVEAALARIGAAVIADPPLAVVLELIAHESLALLDGDGAWVLSLDRAGAGAEIVGADLAAPLAALIPRFGRPGATVPECADLRAIRRAGAALRVDELAALKTGPHPLRRPGVMAPLRRDGAVWGCIVVAAPAGITPAPDAEGRLERVAQLADVAISHAHARADLTAQAFTDPVSGLANDRALRRTLVTALADARETGAELSIALLDVDGFEGLSDVLAQTSGEPVLAEIAQVLMALARPGDTIARVGGDQFAWLMPGTATPQALAVAERARIALAAATFTGVGHLTISAGVASADGDLSAHGLLAAADTALYWARSEGANRVEAHDPEWMIDAGAEQRALRLQREASLAALRALAQTVDAKDPNTRAHSDRVAALAERLARALGWSVHDARRLHDAALVHDIGKIGVPDAVLFKPGRLDPDEFAQVMTHADLGAEIVEGVLDPEQVGWVRHHHERPDGRGYPAGLVRDDIPMGARILAVADSFDVITSLRASKAALGPDEALEEVRRNAGTQFEPRVVAALGRLWLAGLLTGGGGVGG